MEIYQLCLGTYRASKLEVWGIDNFKSFDSKFPYQYSDHTDQVAQYSDIYSKMIPSVQSHMQLQRIRADTHSDETSARTYLQRKTFVDTQTNVAWRASSYRQQELAEVSDINITNSVTVERKKQSSTPQTNGRTKPLLELRVRN